MCTYLIILTFILIFRIGEQHFQKSLKYRKLKYFYNFVFFVLKLKYTLYMVIMITYYLYHGYYNYVFMFIIIYKDIRVLYTNLVNIILNIYTICILLFPNNLIAY